MDLQKKIDEKNFDDDAQIDTFLKQWSEKHGFFVTVEKRKIINLAEFKLGNRYVVALDITKGMPKESWYANFDYRARKGNHFFTIKNILDAYKAKQRV